ncbi:hypothetical protein L596_023386 [Steinernema carpocapsae]|uniref:Uncharacterized protein n=1 Tax=Steinernema carpocapsae TaxID=34508 RepID=A0A4U5MDH3_STECR|nr:hypothetical protein L596_023386 [Steinernema carpocapsae]
MGDRSAYMAPGGQYTAQAPGGGGCTQQQGGYAREDYAWGGASNAGASSSNDSNPPGVTKPRTDVSCYMGPK